jgi:exodeoxyribonuclease VII large subunit
MNSDKILSIKDISCLISKFFNKVLNQNYNITGEVFSVSEKGHIWFTLKDIDLNYSINCVIWNSIKNKYDYELNVGDIIIANGKFNLYEPQNRYTFCCFQIKKKETIENLFKKKMKFFEKKNYFIKNNILNKYNIKKVGLITSFDGQAINDFKKTISNRLFFGDIFLANVNVQGKNCVKSIIEKIDLLENNVDIILITRGGGSFMDLNEFNNDLLIDRIFLCHTPIYCAIGHENDFTICDYVSDLRSSTPTSLALEISLDPNILSHKIKLHLDSDWKFYNKLYNSALDKLNDLHNDIYKFVLQNKPNGFYFNQNYITTLDEFKKICNEKFNIKLLDCEIEFKLENFNVLEKFDSKYTYDKYFSLFDNIKLFKSMNYNIQDYIDKFFSNHNFGTKNNFIICKKLLKIIHFHKNLLIQSHDHEQKIYQNFNISFDINNLSSFFHNLILFKKHLNFLEKNIEDFNHNQLSYDFNSHDLFLQFINSDIHNIRLNEEVLNIFHILKNLKPYYTIL